MALFGGPTTARDEKEALTCPSVPGSEEVRRSDARGRVEGASTPVKRFGGKVETGGEEDVRRAFDHSYGCSPLLTRRGTRR